MSASRIPPGGLRGSSRLLQAQAATKPTCSIIVASDVKGDSEEVHIAGHYRLDSYLPVLRRSVWSVGLARFCCRFGLSGWDVELTAGCGEAGEFGGAEGRGGEAVTDLLPDFPFETIFVMKALQLGL